jgi:hypothetical protein
MVPKISQKSRRANPVSRGLMAIDHRARMFHV